MISNLKDKFRGFIAVEYRIRQNMNEGTKISDMTNFILSYLVVKVF